MLTAYVALWHEAAVRKCSLLRRLWGLSGNRLASSIYENGVELEAQRAPFARFVRLRDAHLPYRLGSVTVGSKLLMQSGEALFEWGKPDLDIICEPCGLKLRSACEGPDADRIDAYVMQACNDRVPED